MKKALSLILAVMLIVCALPIASISAEEAASSIFNLSASDTTTAITGDAVSGYTLSVAKGEYFAMSKTSTPIATASFEFGANSAQGRFGISKTGDISTFASDEENNITFVTLSSGSPANYYIYVKRAGKTYLIATITPAMRQPVGGDAYWGTNISNYGFAEKDGHWYLTIDGIFCNTEEANLEYAQLDRIFGKSFFENNESAYIYVGSYNNADSTKNIFYKPMAVTSTDDAWSSNAVDSYAFNINGTNLEYRGQGLNTADSRAQFARYAIPTVATGTKADGHTVNFTGTNGFAQTSEGFDLKNTKFYVTPIYSEDNTDVVRKYEIGFTANPNALQHHNIKPGETIEFLLASAKNDSANYTTGRIYTNTTGAASPTYSNDLGRVFYWNTHNTSSTRLAQIWFAQAENTDTGETHWYMHTYIDGKNCVIMNADAAIDAYLQFDSIIDKPVYFRMGTNGQPATDFSMYCKIVDTSENGLGGWNTAEKLPTISYAQEVAVSEVKSDIAALGTVNAENILDNMTSAKALLAKYDALSADATAYLSEEEMAFVVELRELVATYAPYAEFTVDEEHAATTTIAGDEVNGYTMALTGSGRTRVITNKAYPIATLSFDYGYNYSGNLFGEFGVSKIADVTNLDDGYSDDNTLTFFYRVTGTKLLVSVRWENKQEVRIGEFDAETYRPGDGYWNPNISNFSFVKVGEHWHLAVDGNICNNVEGSFDYSCLEYMLGEETFDNNEDVYLYVGGYNSGNVYFKQLSAVSEDGAWESRAVDSYKYTFNGAVREYRGQGNTSETVHSAIPGVAVGSKADGHIVDFTGTDGYAQTTDAYDLKTTTFKVAPMLANGDNSTMWYYLGFTADPHEMQYHSSKPSDTIEFRAASVKSDNYTGGWVVTNTSGCLATPTNIGLGRLGQWQTHCYEGNYAQQMAISFVQATGADGEAHWYMQTTVSGANIIVKSDDAATDAYLQFDSIIDKPVYFRMGTDSMKTSTFKMYCKIEGNTVVNDYPLYCDITDYDFVVDYENGAIVDGVEYENGTAFGTMGIYTLKYQEGTTIYNRRLILYTAGDVNADGEINIIDLVALKKHTAGVHTFDDLCKKAADLNGDDYRNAEDLPLLRAKLYN